MIIVIVGWLFWQLGPFAAVFAISNLSDPAKLASLPKRGANSRLNKIVYWLDHARNRGMTPEKAIAWAQLINGCREPRAGMVQTELLRNLRIAEELGLLTSENKEHLRRGQGGIVTRGPYFGEPVEIDHIVPISLAPEVGNELANLEMLPKTLNRAKSNAVGERQVSHAKRLLNAGLLTPESYQRVVAQASLKPIKKKTRL